MSDLIPIKIVKGKFYKDEADNVAVSKDLLEKTEHTFSKSLDKKGEQVFNVIAAENIIFANLITLSSDRIIIAIKNVVHEMSNKAYGKEWTESIGRSIGMGEILTL